MAHKVRTTLIIKSKITVITNDKSNIFEYLLHTNKEITTHHSNLRVLMVELSKVKNDIAPPIMDDLFLFRENAHNIRKFQVISNKTKKIVRYDLETVKHRKLLLWANLPEEYGMEKQNM